MNKIILTTISLALVIGCNQNDILPSKHLIFEDNFQGDYTWLINGEIDSSIVNPGEAYGEYSNGILYLDATGCTEVNASLPLKSDKLTDEKHEKMTITIDVDEYNYSPMNSSSNKIEISFKNFHLTIKPKKDINNLLLTFKLFKNNIDLAEQTDAIEYIFSRNSKNNHILVNLKSESIADCIANANLQLKSIKIYRE